MVNIGKRNKILLKNPTERMEGIVFLSSVIEITEFFT